MTDPLRPATLAAHVGLSPDPVTGAVVPPLVASSIFVHGNPGGYAYGREGNPLWERLEGALAALEEGRGAVVFSSGMAAIAAVLELVPLGGIVVGPHNGYSGTRRLLAHMHEGERIQARIVDIADTAAVAEACSEAALCLLESVTNPLLTVPDLRACIAAAGDAGALVAVDNTLTTPCLLRPLALGADIVIHSLTKYAGGHSDLILGAAVARDEGLVSRIRDWRTAAGAIPGQLETWLVLRGLRTLDVRVRRQVDNAAVLAERLSHHPAVSRVHYPGLPSHPHHDRARALLSGGFGAMVSIELEGGAERAEAVCGSTRIWTHATSLGAVESTLERRARYALDAGVVSPALIRLSVGIEDADDLYDDLDLALSRPDG